MIEEGVKIKENSWIARLAALKLGKKKCAITIADTIHLYNTSREDFMANKKWVRHELKHVEQYKAHGMVRYWALYLYESMRKGYHNNKFEVEAREAEE